MEKEEILGVKIDSLDYEKIVESIIKKIENRARFYVVTPNPEIIIEAQEDLEFLNILNQADISIPDGEGTVWASKLLKGNIEKRISGTDLMYDLCRVSEKFHWSIFLLGGQNGVVYRLKIELERQFPKINIIGCMEGSPKIQDDVITKKEILKLIGNKDIDMLFIAYGASKQEKWIERNIKKLPVKMAMGVGGAFDYLSGNIERSPKWMRRLGLEWFYRLLRQPWRWKRQMKLVKFIILILKDRIKL